MYAGKPSQITYGCSKCRHRQAGCGKCRHPDYKCTPILAEEAEKTDGDVEGDATIQALVEKVSTTLCELIHILTELALGDGSVSWSPLFEMADKVGDGGVRVLQHCFGLFQQYGVEIHNGTLFPTSRSSVQRLFAGVCKAYLQSVESWQKNMNSMELKELVTLSVEAWHRYNSKTPSEAAPAEPSTQVEAAHEVEAREVQQQAEWRRAEGDELFGRGQNEQAIEKYSEALMLLQQDPSGWAVAQSAECCTSRADCHKQLQNHDMVIKDCSRAIESAPLDPRPLMLRAQAYESLERYFEAVDDYRIVLALQAGSTRLATAAIQRLTLLLPSEIGKKSSGGSAKTRARGSRVGPVFQATLPEAKTHQKRVVESSVIETQARRRRKLHVN